MDLQTVLSDNQIAVLGCFAALAVCGGIAAFSFRFGAAGQIYTRTPNSPNLRLASFDDEFHGNRGGFRRDQRRAA